MRTDSFSREKHLPVRRFIADESKVATGLYGPRAIADDLDNLCAMFDPEADILDGEQKGGIGEKNLQNGAVTFEKLSDSLKDKFNGLFINKELEQQLAKKADKATTLSGYGITDALSRAEAKAAFSDMEDSVSACLKETILLEMVIDTPVWANQPTVTGDISCFSADDYYYVTFQDAEGNALPENQFMLKEFYTEDAQVYAPVFTLEGLNTGNATLTENLPVEPCQSGNALVWRTAGVSIVLEDIKKQLQNDVRYITTRMDGSFIKTAGSQYFSLYYLIDKPVSNYHSGVATTWNSDGGKYIWHYVSMGFDHYKESKFTDELRLACGTKNTFYTNRNILLRCLPWGTTAYKHYSQQSVGFGAFSDPSTMLNKIGVSAANGGGYIRNGTVITVTEVK